MILIASIPAWLQLKSETRHDALFHYSVMDAMRNGVYTGELSIKALRQKGDFGLGTFNQLDGELIALDGRFYRVAADGTLAEAEQKRLVPFASLAFFTADQKLELAFNGDFEAMQQLLQQRLPSPNQVYAIKIECTFKEITVGGANELAENDTTGIADLMQTRPLYHAKDIKGTIVGFYHPSYLNGIDLSPFHFHFISSNHQFGGHLVAGKLANATLKISLDAKAAYELKLLENERFHQPWKKQSAATKSY